MLQELSPEQASDAINDKMRKDLQSAYELASEGHGLDFYKELLQQFQEELVANEEVQKAKKKKVVDEMDIDAVDKTPAKKSKKRKAEDEVVVSVPPDLDNSQTTFFKLANWAVRRLNDRTLSRSPRLSLRAPRQRRLPTERPPPRRQARARPSPHPRPSLRRPRTRTGLLFPRSPN